MSLPLTVLLAQINPTVGAIDKNAAKIIEIINDYQQTHDLIIFPELAICGYPPEDLLLRGDFHAEIEEALNKILSHCKDCHVIIGHPSLEGGEIFNAASVFYQASRVAIYHKQHLPNYGVFDEMRYFKPGDANPPILNIKNCRLGLCICEDLWKPGPVEQIAKAGAEVIICINASPFDYDKYTIREKLLKKHAKLGLITFYVNQVGGQDELVFDGQSFVVNAKGEVCARAVAFKEEFLTVTIENQQVQGKISPLSDKNKLIYDALVCGTKDYVEKNGFPGVLLGLSGGIDSALTLVIAVDALGPERVHAVLMPSRYTAQMSIDDALEQLKALAVPNTTISIEPAFISFLEMLAPSFKGLRVDVTEENLQARIRGMLLMALSNKTGKMVLTTSNKSETAVGYATLYGDMVGGFAVLKDVLKTQVYTLANYRNSLSEVIPQRVIERAPSAELAPDQKDQDSLPDYATLDGIIKAFMENNQSVAEIVAQGYSEKEVQHVIRMLSRNEYKRRQAAPGVKISPRAFDRDWRNPITSGFEA